ncbi:glutamine-rich protein 2 [Meles meles]|uniref:glutamine-rich protein 2 n=1 Tax=Meles meles TaxID=9662 RepID=UPI001E6994BF|nr:glutamine-rich protein 2 [Meles meles]
MPPATAATTTVSLRELADLAIGTPEVGAVNFTALHTLIVAMLRSLNLQEVRIDFQSPLPSPETSRTLELPQAALSAPQLAASKEKPRGSLTKPPTATATLESQVKGLGGQVQDLSRKLKTITSQVQGIVSHVQHLTAPISELDARDWLEEETAKLTPARAEAGSLKIAKGERATVSQVSQAMELLRDVVEEVKTLKEAQEKAQDLPAKAFQRIDALEKIVRERDEFLDLVGRKMSLMPAGEEVTMVTWEELEQAIADGWRASLGGLETTGLPQRRGHASATSDDILQGGVPITRSSADRAVDSPRAYGSDQTFSGLSGIRNPSEWVTRERSRGASAAAFPAREKHPRARDEAGVAKAHHPSASQSRVESDRPRTRERPLHSSAHLRKEDREAQPGPTLQDLSSGPVARDEHQVHPDQQWGVDASQGQTQPGSDQHGLGPYGMDPLAWHHPRTYPHAVVPHSMGQLGVMPPGMDEWGLVTPGLDQYGTAPPVVPGTYQQGWELPSTVQPGMVPLGTYQYGPGLPGTAQQPGVDQRGLVPLTADQPGFLMSGMDQQGLVPHLTHQHGLASPGLMQIVADRQGFIQPSLETAEFPHPGTDQHDIIQPGPDQHGLVPAGAGLRGLVQPGAGQPGAGQPGAGQHGLVHPGASQRGLVQPRADRHGLVQTLVDQSGLVQPGAYLPDWAQPGAYSSGWGQPGAYPFDLVQPNIYPSGLVQPSAVQPGLSQSGIGQHDSAHLRMDQHPLVEPEMDQHGLVQVGMDHRVLFQPGTVQPTLMQPGAGQRGLVQPVISQRDLAQPGIDQHESVQLGMDQRGLVQPGAGQPGLGQPGVDQRGLVQPGAGQPSMDQRGLVQPGTGQPGLAQPGMGQHGLVQPGTGQPGLPQPGMDQRGLVQPGAGQPGLGQPGMDQHGLVQPGAGQPGLGQPGMGQRGLVQPGARQPGLAQPGVDQRGLVQPGAGQPGMDQPGADQPRLAQPGMGQHGLVQPGAVQPHLAQPGMDQRGLVQSGASQPGLPQPGMDQRGLVRPGAGQPGLVQPGMDQHGLVQPGADQPGLAPPGIVQRGMVPPGAGQPDLAQPDMDQHGLVQTGSGQPGLAQPGMDQRGLVQPGAGQPGLAQPGMDQRGLVQTGSGQPGLAQPRMDQRGLVHPGAGQPGLAQPGMDHRGLVQPGAGQPGLAQPGMDQRGLVHPGAGQPGLAQPGMDQRGLVHPGAGQPGLAQPGMDHRGLVQPGSGQPGLAQPGMDQRGLVIPGAGQPGLAQPGMDQRGLVHPGAGQSGLAQPILDQHGLVQPGAGQRGLAQPRVDQRGLVQPGAAQPGMVQPRMDQGGLVQPGTGQPGLVQPVLDQRGLVQPGVGQPGMVQPALVQPGAGQGGLDQPGTDQLGLGQRRVDQRGLVQADTDPRGSSQPGAYPPGLIQPGAYLQGLGQSSAYPRGSVPPGAYPRGLVHPGTYPHGFMQPRADQRGLVPPEIDQHGLRQPGTGQPGVIPAGTGLRGFPAFAADFPRSLAHPYHPGVTPPDRHLHGQVPALRANQGLASPGIGQKGLSETDQQGLLHRGTDQHGLTPLSPHVGSAQRDQQHLVSPGPAQHGQGQAGPEQQDHVSSIPESWDRSYPGPHGPGIPGVDPRVQMGLDPKQIYASGQPAFPVRTTPSQAAAFPRSADSLSYLLRVSSEKSDFQSERRDSLDKLAPTFPMAVETFRLMGELLGLYVELKENMKELDEEQAGQTDLEKIQYLLGLMVKKAIPPDLQEQLNTLKSLTKEVRQEKAKTERMQKILEGNGEHETGKDTKDGSLSLQLGILRVTVADIEKELAELRESQERGKVSMEHSVSEASLYLQDQLDKLRAIIENMMASSSTLLSLSMAPHKTLSNLEPGQIDPEATCPACSLDLSHQVSTLVRRYEQLQDMVNNLAASRPSKKAKLQSQDEELLGHVQSAILQVQGDCEKLNITTSSLIEDHRQKQKDIDVLYQGLEKLEKEKANREHLEMEIDVKADKSALAAKVSRVQFDATTEQLNHMMQELVTKMSGHEQDWQKMLDKLLVEMDSKLDRLELDPLKKLLEDRWKSLRQQLKERSPLYQADEAAVMRRQLLAHFHCLSCDRPLETAVTGQFIPVTPVGPALPGHRSIRPYTIFELEQVRQQSRNLKLGGTAFPRGDLAHLERSVGRLRTMHSKMLMDIEKVQIHFGGSVKASSQMIRELLQAQCLSSPCYKRVPETADYVYSSVPRRCGGSHTLTYPYRRSRLQHLSQGLYPTEEVQIAMKHEEVDILGLDGHIYKGRMDTRLPGILTKDSECPRGPDTPQAPCPGVPRGLPSPWKAMGPLDRGCLLLLLPRFQMLLGGWMEGWTRERMECLEGAYPLVPTGKPPPPTRGGRDQRPCSPLPIPTGPHRAPTQHLRMDPPLHRPPPASVSGMTKHNKAKQSRPHVRRQQSLSDNGQLPSRPQSAQMLAGNSPAAPRPRKDRPLSSEGRLAQPGAAHPPSPSGLEMHMDLPPGEGPEEPTRGPRSTTAQ